MRRAASALLGLSMLGAACSDAGAPLSECREETEVSMDDPLDLLRGESPRERLARAAKSWSCTMRWLELPPQIGSTEPGASESPLGLTLESDSETASVRRGVGTTDRGERVCSRARVYAPIELGLVSEDGALNERLGGELRLEAENTLVNLALGAYDFAGSHSTTFAGDVRVDTVELNLSFYPGPDPRHVDGTLVEGGARPGPGSDPYVTTAAVQCTAEGG